MGPQRKTSNWILIFWFILYFGFGAGLIMFDFSSLYLQLILIVTWMFLYPIADHIWRWKQKKKFFSQDQKEEMIGWRK